MIYNWEDAERQVEALTCTGAVRRYDRRIGNVEVLKNGSTHRNDRPSWEDGCGKLPSQLFRRPIAAYSQNWCD